MTTRLDPILASVRARAHARRLAQPLAELRRSLKPEPMRRERFLRALQGPELAFICEIKRRSPSAGTLVHELDVLARAHAYAAGGAHALSILTEEEHFGGALGDLQMVEPAGLPRLRKDFVLDEGMLWESLAYGADAVLLLAVCLPDPLLKGLSQLARELGLAVLLEVHTEAELERALAAQPDCIGVNARDLTSLQVNLATSERLLPRIPAGYLRVAESGLSSVSDLQRVQGAGAQAALIGEALMRHREPERLLKHWKAALHGQ